MMRFSRLTPRRSRRLARKLLASVVALAALGRGPRRPRGGLDHVLQGRLAPDRPGRLVDEIALFARRGASVSRGA